MLQHLKDQIRMGKPLIGAGAGTGISAKFEEAGGVDLIVLYNSGRFRMAGRGSLAGLLPFADANAVVLEMANEVLPVSSTSSFWIGIHYSHLSKECEIIAVQCTYKFTQCPLNLFALSNKDTYFELDLVLSC